MAEITLYFSIAAIWTFTFHQIHGLNVSVKCEDINYTPVGEECYRVNSAVIKWSEASEQCHGWNGKLATFKDLDHMVEVFTALGQKDRKLWIGAQKRSQGSRDEWAAIHSEGQDNMSYYSDGCFKSEKPSICSGNALNIDNNMTANDSNLTMTTSATPREQTALNEIVKRVTCIHNDSRVVDGKCYRLSAEPFIWSDAKTYCNSWNATVAQISFSEELGLTLLLTMDVIYKFVWVADPYKPDQARFIVLTTNQDCMIYEYGIMTTNQLSCHVLCIEKDNLESNSKRETTSESTIQSESSTTQNSVTGQESTDKHETATTQNMISTPESTKSESITTTNSITTRNSITIQESTNKEESTTIQNMIALQESTNKEESTTTQKSISFQEANNKSMPSIHQEPTTIQDISATTEKTFTTKLTITQELTSTAKFTTIPKLTTTHKYTTTLRSQNRQVELNQISQQNRLLELNRLLHLNQQLDRNRQLNLHIQPQLNQRSHQETKVNRLLDQNHFAEHYQNPQQYPLLYWYALMNFEFK